MTTEATQNKSNKGRTILVLLGLLAIIAFVVGYQKYQDIFGPAVPDTIGTQTFFEIPTNTTFEEVVTSLSSQKIIQDPCLLYTSPSPRDRG